MQKRLLEMALSIPLHSSLSGEEGAAEEAATRSRVRPHERAPVEGSGDGREGRGGSRRRGGRRGRRRREAGRPRQEGEEEEEAATRARWPGTLEIGRAHV